MSDFMTGFAEVVRHVCQQGKDTINLDIYQTIEFFGHRKMWAERGIKVRCIPGKLEKLNLPSFPLPVRAITREVYTMDDVRIVPAFEYHSIVNYFYRNRYANIIPARKNDAKQNEVSHVS